MRSRRGFTLTELLVVVAIIILLVAVSVPAFLSATKAGRLSAGVRTVQAALMAARNLAIAHNAIYSVEFGEVLTHDLDLDPNATPATTLNADYWQPDDQGYFVAVQREDLAGDVIVRDISVLPLNIALAFGSDTAGTEWEWTAKQGWVGNTDTDGNDQCVDIAFQPDGSSADAQGETTVVLYDSSEEPGAEGEVTAAVITVVKYTGEILIETVKALLADLQ